MKTDIDEFYRGFFEAEEKHTTEQYLLRELERTAHGCSMCFNPLEITICNELGSYYRQMGAYDKSEHFFDMAANRISENVGPNSVEYATVINNAAGTFRLSGNYNKSIEYFHKAGMIYRNVMGTDNEYYCSILNNLGLLYLDMGDTEKAEKNLTEALAISRKLDNMMFTAITYTNLGTLCLRKKDYVTAEENLKKSITVFGNLEERQQVHLSAAYNGLASVYMETGRPKEALPLYLRARDLTLHFFGENPEYRILEENIKKAREAVENS